MTAAIAVPPHPGLQEMAATALRHRRKALAALLLPIVLAVAVIVLLPPKYRAQADILVKTGREYLAEADGLSGMTAPTSTKQESINSEIALLTGRAVVERVIARFGIDALYPGLVEDPPWWGTLQDAAVYKFHKDLRAEPVKLSNIITVSFDASSPAKARQVLDALIQADIAKHAEVFATPRSDSYAQAIGQTRQELTRLEQQRTQIKRDSGTFDIGAQRGALITQRVSAQAHLLDVVNTTQTLTRRLAFLQAALPGLDRTMTTTITDRDETGVHSRQVLTDLRATEASLSARYGDSYPDVQRVRGQIAAVQHQIGAAERTNVTTAPAPLAQQVQAEIVMDRAQLAPLADERTRYEALAGQLADELQRLEQADLDLRLLGQQIDALAGELKSQQVRFDQARTQEEMDRARQVSVVQVAPAIVPDRAAKPNKLLFLAGGVMFGLLSAGTVMVGAVLTTGTVTTAAGAERLLGLPVLVSLPLAPGGQTTLELQ